MDGKKYISTKRAAELSKYSKDYVGQLARSGKIHAKLVGRSWYIEQDSIMEHLAGRDQHEMPSIDSDISSDDESDISSEFKNHSSKVSPKEKDDSILHTTAEVENNADSEFKINEKTFIEDNLHSEILDSEKTDVRKSVGSSGWRSLWGVPVYETENVDLIPVTNKSTHLKHEEEFDPNDKSNERREIESRSNGGINNFYEPSYRRVDTKAIRSQRLKITEPQHVRVTIPPKFSSKESEPINNIRSNIEISWLNPKLAVYALGSVFLLLTIFYTLSIILVKDSSEKNSIKASWYTFEYHYKR